MKKAFQITGIFEATIPVVADIMIASIACPAPSLSVIESASAVTLNSEMLKLTMKASGNIQTKTNVISNSVTDVAKSDAG